jgi:hypothetical protein
MRVGMLRIVYCVIINRAGSTGTGTGAHSSTNNSSSDAAAAAVATVFARQPIQQPVQRQQTAP